MFIARQMDKQNVCSDTHTHIIEYSAALQRMEILLLATT